MLEIKVPISVGELIDKITILKIKKQFIVDPSKTRHIVKELQLLTAVCETCGIDLATPLVLELYGINERLWLIEDQIRDKERLKEFDQTFIDLARSVYRTNDQRFMVKKKLNDSLGSALVEEKSYQQYES